MAANTPKSIENLPSTNTTTTTAPSQSPLAPPPPPQQTNILKTLISQPHAPLRLALFVPIITGLILTAAASPPHLAGRVSDDGLGSAFCWLALISFPISLANEAALLCVPLLPRFRRISLLACFGRSRQDDAADVDDDGKDSQPHRLRMHPAVPLAFEACVGAEAISMAVVCALIAGGLLTGALLGALVMLFVVAVGHAVLMGFAARDVHRLRKEQVSKRDSLRAAEGGNAFNGWVELEGPRGGGGAGGGL